MGFTSFTQAHQQQSTVLPFGDDLNPANSGGNTIHNILGKTGSFLGPQRHTAVKTRAQKPEMQQTLEEIWYHAEVDAKYVQLDCMVSIVFKLHSDRI